MSHSLIKPQLTNLSGSVGRLSGAIVERDIDRPGRQAVSPSEAASALPRHVLVVPTESPRRLGWKIGGTHKRAVFASGDVILNPAGLDTQPTWSRETELVLFAANPSLLNRTAQQIGRSATVELVPRYPTDDALLHHFALTLAAEFEHDGPPDLLYAESLTHALVAHLVKCYTVEGASALTVGRGLSDATCGACQTYIGDRLGDTITLEDIAELAGYSPSHFIDLFKRSTGTTPHRT